MSNRPLKTEINLQSIEGHFVKKGKDGKEYIILPIGGVVERHSEKDIICIRLVGWELKNKPGIVPMHGDIPKGSEKKTEMDGEYPTTHAWTYLPDDEYSSGSVQPASTAPVFSTTAAQSAEKTEENRGLPEGDDLPF